MNDGGMKDDPSAQLPPENATGQGAHIVRDELRMDINNSDPPF